MRVWNRPIAVTALAVAGLLLGVAAAGTSGAADAGALATADPARGAVVRWHGTYCKARSGEGWRHATAFGATAAAAAWVARRRRLPR